MTVLRSVSRDVLSTRISREFASAELGELPVLSPEYLLDEDERAQSPDWNDQPCGRLFWEVLGAAARNSRISSGQAEEFMMRYYPGPVHEFSSMRKRCVSVYLQATRPSPHDPSYGRCYRPYLVVALGMPGLELESLDPDRVPDGSSEIYIA